MALIRCKECGKEISDTAKVCSNCGAKTEKTKQQNKKIKNIIIVFAIISVILGIIFVIKTNNPLHKYSREAINILEDFQDNKLTNSQACQKIKQIALQIENIYESTNNLDYMVLESILLNTEAKIYANSTNEIDTCIEKLKKY
jgi:predicted nucleic acid-binding Zn ribbon protein